MGRSLNGALQEASTLSIDVMQLKGKVLRHSLYDQQLCVIELLIASRPPVTIPHIESLPVRNIEDFCIL